MHLYFSCFSGVTDTSPFSGLSGVIDASLYSGLSGVIDNLHFVFCLV